MTFNQYLKENIGCQDWETLRTDLEQDGWTEQELKVHYDDLVIQFNDYRDKMQEKQVGRPSLGITKKVSITLTAEDWEWIEEKAQGNSSQFLRKLVWEARSPEKEWSNDACLGYAMLGAAQLYNGKVDNVDEKIEELVRAIYLQFDTHTIDQAKKMYREELDWIDA